MSFWTDPYACTPAQDPVGLDRYVHFLPAGPVPGPARAIPVCRRPLYSASPPRQTSPIACPFDRFTCRPATIDLSIC
jgi:hypothetical protein